MSDYIKREDAIKTLEGWKISGEIILATVPSADVVEADKAQKEIDYWHDKAQSYEQTILKLSLNKADVVEVVRCKDCKHWHDNTEFCDQCRREAFIDAQPTADVRENVRGEWLNMERIEDYKAEYITEWQQAQCSVCHKWHTTPYMYFFTHDNFCPNCGAEMRAKP